MLTSGLARAVTLSIAVTAACGTHDSQPVEGDEKSDTDSDAKFKAAYEAGELEFDRENVPAEELPREVRLAFVQYDLEDRGPTAFHFKLGTRAGWLIENRDAGVFDFAELFTARGRKIDRFVIDESGESFWTGATVRPDFPWINELKAAYEAQGLFVDSDGELAGIDVALDDLPGSAQERFKRDEKRWGKDHAHAFEVTFQDKNGFLVTGTDEDPGVIEGTGMSSMFFGPDGEVLAEGSADFDVPNSWMWAF
jgi:hypothetical protein